MIRDVVLLLRQMREVLHLIRGVVATLLATLGLCALVLMVVERLSLGEALYLTARTGLTVGYGDLAPATPIGRIASVVVGLVGVVVVGIVVAVANQTLARAIEDKRRQGRPPPDEGTSP